MRVGIRIRFEPPDLARRLRDSSIVRQEIRRAIRELAVITHAGARRRAPVDTGRLRSSIGFSLSGLTAEVGSMVRHAAPMEYGAKPHMPPQMPIQAWVRRVLGIRDPRQAATTAWFVRRAIARRGLKERRYLRDALADALRVADRVLGEAVRRIVARWVR